MYNKNYVKTDVQILTQRNFIHVIFNFYKYLKVTTADQNMLPNYKN